MANGSNWWQGLQSWWQDWWRRWPGVGAQFSPPPEQRPVGSYLGMYTPYTGGGRYGPSRYPYKGAYPGSIVQGAPTRGPYWPTTTQAQPAPTTTQPTTRVEPVPGQYTPSRGFGMLPPPETRATPGTVPVRTPVEQALADVVAAAAPEPQREIGPWGGQLGSYPIPNITWNVDPRLAEWEQWSWSERGIPLQGYELWRLSRNRPPWGVPPRE